jgi:hypothetical protein
MFKPLMFVALVGCSPCACALLLMLHHSQDHLPADTAVAVLQLAMNCSNPAIAAEAAFRIPYSVSSAARDMPTILQPAVARKLLLAAATRQHGAALAYMLTLPAMLQHLDAATLEAMLMQLLQDYDCVKTLCQLPVAAELSIATVTQLLLAACQEREYEAARVFCGLDAAQQISSEQIEALLQPLMPHTVSYDSVRVLVL